MVKMFRMADKQQAARLEQTRKALQQALLRRRIEINHHVAAENGVERPGNGPLFIE